MPRASSEPYAVSSLKAHLLRLLEKSKRTGGLPAFSTTVEALRGFRSEAEPSPERLVNVVLADPGLCLQILRAANSVFFNPMNLPARTVSRAVVVIGLENAKQIALAAPRLEEDLLRREEVRREFALSLLIAHLARGAADRGYLPPEESYLAGLFRRLARLVILLLAPATHRRLNRLPPGQQRELLLLFGRGIARHWNLPAPVRHGLEGQEAAHLGRPTLFSLCDRLAQALLDGEAPLPWQGLFDEPEGVRRALAGLEDKLPLLPPPLSQTLSAVLSPGEEVFSGEPREPVHLPEGVLTLVRRALEALGEELGARGRLFYLDEDRLVAPEREPLSPEAEGFLRRILARGRPYAGEGEGHFLYLPLSFGGRPAILLGLKREAPFTEEELFALDLFRRTFQRLLAD